MKKQIQAGFTLIELVVVIVILGILAAVAVPKFVDLSSDARSGVMKGVEAAMSGANTMIYGKAAAAGIANQASVLETATVAPLPISTDGGTTKVGTAYGYARNITELNKALNLTPSADFNVDTTNNEIQHKGAKNYTTAPSTCATKYTAPTTSGGAPTYVTTTGGC